MLEELLRIENGIVEKNGQELIKGLHLQAYKGEILGLISDNIREKQCILDVLNGTVNLDYGSVSFEENQIQDYEVSQVLKNKIAVIESKSKLVNNLSVAENIFVVRGGFKKYFINKRLLYRQAGGLLSEFKLEIHPESYAGRLTPLERCMVELVKAYATGHRLIVCCDFTSFLSSTEVKKAFISILWLKKKGVGFIFIENHDNVLFDYSDRVAVIHNGKTVRIFDGEDTDKDTVYTLLMGESDDQQQEREGNYVPSPINQSPVVFEIDRLSSIGLSNLSFQLHEGEILNILYQEEECCNELLGLMKGESKNFSGLMKLENKQYNPLGLWDAIKKGVCFIEEDPITKMLFFDMSVVDNLCFTMSNKVKGFWFHRKYRKSIIKFMEDIFNNEILMTPMSELEPVTLQKLAYSKWLLYMPKVVVCKKPFSAVDVHMRQVTEQLINTYTKKGITVLILTSNISEAHTMGECVLHLKGGSIKEESQ
ncbi:MAG: ABC-type sugar transport system ATPase component-like protein [Herbinix sp.]|jgi:ribose transport system ATP-binding protein|nr:ABC-type sugar transport system ATPase component-like protein [Herbinix sp.]